MQRAMIFIDFENFSISLASYYNQLGQPVVKLDYEKFPNELVKLLPQQSQLVKTFLCAPKPDKFLMGNPSRASTYNWINSLKNYKYLTVLEGEHIARPLTGFTPQTMDINNRSSYYVVEKGTDINMAVHMVSKGFLNAYDIAVMVSGDSDYIPILDILNTIGKVTVTVGVHGQNLARLKPHSDDVIILDANFFANCVR